MVEFARVRRSNDRDQQRGRSIRVLRDQHAEAKIPTAAKPALTRGFFARRIVVGGVSEYGCDAQPVVAGVEDQFLMTDAAAVDNSRAWCLVASGYELLADQSAACGATPRHKREPPS